MEIQPIITTTSRDHPQISCLGGMINLLASSIDLLVFLSIKTAESNVVRDECVERKVGNHGNDTHTSQSYRVEKSLTD